VLVVRACWREFQDVGENTKSGRPPVVGPLARQRRLAVSRHGAWDVCCALVAAASESYGMLAV
jgi:hypothetical protein